MLNGWRIALAATLALVLAACGGGGPQATDRVTTLGPVRGAEVQGALAWKGIPYAQPPVGALRWRAPQAHRGWTTPRDASAFAAACLQNGRIYGPGSNNTYDDTIAETLGTPVGSEDCLTLNVWRPPHERGNLPVIFFVYGGSNISGYTADPVYDGAALARRADAVVVTANYRVGPLGFFFLPQLQAGVDAQDASGNFALLDLIQALKFVQANAAVFGGNPGNVTLMGQSAGAINVWALLTSPLAQGLFHRAAPLSGGISLASNLPPATIPTLNPSTVYAAQANALLAHLLVADGTVADLAAAPAYIASQDATAIAAYLRGKDAREILGTLLANGLTGSGPIPDGTVLPTDPIGAIAAGRYNRMPVLAGNTGEEGKLFAPFMTLFGGPPGFRMSDAERFRLMADFDPDAANTLTEADILDPFYVPSGTPGTGWTARANLLGAVFMAPSRDNALNTLRTQQDDVWYYRFDWKQEPAPWNTVYGAAHAFDLPFLFGNFGPSLFSNAIGGRANQRGRLALSAAMMDSVGAFARTGDPNHAGLGTTWRPWPARLVFDASRRDLRITTE